MALLISADSYSLASASAFTSSSASGSCWHSDVRSRISTAKVAICSSWPSTTAGPHLFIVSASSLHMRMTTELRISAVRGRQYAKRGREEGFR
jgi:hypothetical protein